MSHKDIDGRALANEILTDVGERVAGLKAAGWFPKLVSISVGDNPAAAFYVRNQRRRCEQVGIEFEERQYREEISPQELYAAIWALNADPRVTGIIIQRPVPASLSIKQLQAAIDPLKDVEGMHPTSIGNIVYRELDLAPCTAMASVELLRRTGVQLEGLEATIIGHSEIVGKPIAFLLMAEGATVTVCHHMTRDVGMHSRRADAVFVAVGKPDLLNGDMIKPGAIVIDIGINQVTDADGKERVVGDCNYASCVETAGWITPVPGGVGPVTVSILMRNAAVATQRLKDHYESQLNRRL
ncbi:MAG: bifunctional 5,10-methylenetetrahydrofolate dehydrogenase/5,10-methenyltetrahydrofolate cyclohydrolase [Halofilum sp. (in: g-proteobacteria)]|nr:bifunctional 5,10-methylenetetrahydrofolate dehydrogenase/5,10-methenyltetrahydrofolate cyclohydrolase [Halofilum sp. (in: g-proteobacteria)]